MTQRYLSQVMLKNTAEAIIVPLKEGISSLNEFSQAVINADVDPVSGKCSNYNSIREHIVQAHHYLQRSEQTASSGLKSLDESLENLIQDEKKLECDKRSTEIYLQNLRTEQESYEKSLRDSQGALEQANRNLDSAKQTLQDQERRKRDAAIVTGVGGGVLVIPVIGWIAGPIMLTVGAVELDQANKAVTVAGEEVEKSENGVKKYQRKVYEYEYKISQTQRDIAQKDSTLIDIRQGILLLKNQIMAVAEFQEKVRRAVHLLGVLSGRVGTAELQTRRFILQQPVMKVMKEVMEATEQITGSQLLYGSDLTRLIDQMKSNGRRLEAF